MERLLVTGGAGFIGSAFVRRVLGDAAADRVVVLDKLTYAGSLASLDAVRSVGSRLHFVRGDIGDRALVAQLLAEHRPRAIVNFAAESHVDRSIDAPAPFVMTNVVGTASLLEATLEYWRTLSPTDRERFRLLHISTDEVFGSIAAPNRADERSPYAPSSPYAASKAAGDYFVRAFHRTCGLPTLLTYSTNNYGPFQFPEKLVPVVILNALEGRPIPLFGDGQHQRDWLHVEDHSDALRIVLERGQTGDAYCIASGRHHMNRELVALICDEIDRQCAALPHRPTSALVQQVADRPGHDRRYALDASKVRALGWQARIPLEQGIRETVAWYLANRQWVAEISRGFDRAARMGLGLGPQMSQMNADESSSLASN
ncbi:MAG: dTDP-glucose 4,6-dehydratase [Pirellulales bacterium]